MTTRRDCNNCRYCGREVIWTESKKGKRYLAVPTPIFGDDGRIIKWIYPAHRCSASESEKQWINDEIKAEHEKAIERGEIVTGQRVVIFKGRKFPVGTTGMINWVAREEDQFGVIKVRIVLDSGESIYVNRENVRAATVKAGA